MARSLAYPVYVCSFAVSAVVLAIGFLKSSPTLAAAGSVSVLLSILYVIELARAGKAMVIAMPIAQILTLLLSLVLSQFIETDFFYGHLVGTISYPVLAAAIMASVIAFCGGKLYAELMVFFALIGTCAVSNIAGIFMIALDPSKVDTVYTNQMAYQNFVLAFGLGVVYCLSWYLYSVMIRKQRFYVPEDMLEVKE